MRRLIGLLGMVAVLAAAPGMASAQEPSDADVTTTSVTSAATSAPEPADQTRTTSTSASAPVVEPSTPVAPEVGAGQYSTPEWWPLRGSNLIGCTRNSPDRAGLHICQGNYHPVWAIDIEGPSGQNVYAAGAGQAFQHTDPGCTGYGNYITINHNGRWSLYGHLSSFSVANGAWVDQNPVIGKVGHTGNVSGCSYNHLHYEESMSGSWWTGAVDPGAVKACLNDQVVTYPNAFGATSWSGLRGHTYTATSSGNGCGGGSQPLADGDLYRIG